MKRTTILTFVVVAVSIVHPHALRAGTAPSASVLIVHSYHQTLLWNRAIQRGIDERFAASPASVELYIEYLDVKRNPDAVSVETLVAFLSDRYGDMSIDLVLVSDDAALTLVKEYRDAIAPDAPVVFSGIDHLSAMGGLSAYDWLTGVVEGIDIEANIELARSLWPDTTDVYVLGDTTAIAETHRGVIRELEPVYADEVRFHYLIPDSRTDMRRRVGSLPARSVLLYLHFHYTEADGFLNFEEIIPEIAESSSVPVLGAWDFSIHLGLTAGYVTDGYKQGWTMADQGLAILSGRAPSEVDPVTESPNTYVVNEPGLMRYDAHMAAVPPGATVLNHRPTFVEQHGDALMVAAIVLVVLGTITALLGFHARRIKHSETRVRALNDQLSRTVSQKSMLMRESHHRIKNNLQVLEGLVSLEMNDAADKATNEVLSTLKNRCRAIGLVHKQLYRTDDVERVSLHTYFGELIDHLYSLLIDTSAEGGVDRPIPPVAIEKRIEHVHARMDTAVPLGLITTELISNSLKHAAADRDARSPLTISIDLERTSDSSVALVVRDNGRGYNGAHQHSEGLGLSLVRSLSAQLGGSIRFFDDGGAGIELVWREKVER